MLRKVLIALVVLAVLFLVAPGTASLFVHAQGTTAPAPQDVLTDVSKIVIGVVIGVITGTVVGAPIIALFLLRGILNSPAVLQFLKHLADSLSPEWKQVLQASGTLIDDISGSGATLQPYKLGTGGVPPSGGGTSTGGALTQASAAATSAPPSIQAQLSQQ